MNKKITSLIISSIFLSVSLNSNAQDNSYQSPIDIAKQESQSFEKPLGEYQEKYTSQDIFKLDELLEEQNYMDFYDKFSYVNVDSKYQIEYLNKKIYDGHVPLYWLMADYYAKLGDKPNTHKWLSIATIMTQQDASLCSDSTSLGASKKLARAFPKAVNVVNTSPELILQVMNEVFFFIDNLRDRSDPVWACNFGEKDLAENGRIVVDKIEWENTRARVLQKYKNEF